MAEKNRQNFASANGYSREDVESAILKSDEELKRQKRIKLAMYIGGFIAFQIIVMTVFGLTVMKVKTPKIKLGAISVQNLNSIPKIPSFDTTFTTQNWGPYKFNVGTATFMYQGVVVGQVSIPKSKAGMCSAKKIDVTVSLNSNGLPSSNLGSNLNGGTLTLSTQAKLIGKVELIFIMKKKKSATMDCTISFDLSSKTVQSLQCT